MQLPLRGIILPLATPLAGSRPIRLDAAGLERLIEHVIAGGVHGIFLLGTTGEFCSLSHHMREEIIRRASEQVNGRVPVLAGISDTALPETLRMAEVAAECGASAVVLAAPYYFEHSQADLLFYLEQLSVRLPLPLFLYNIPHLTKTSYEPETVRRASEMDGVIGLKDSTGDLRYLARVLELVRDQPAFSVLLGPEELLAEGMSLGAHGGVCGGANLEPGLFVELYNAVRRGDEECVSQLQAKVLEMGRALYTTGAPGGSYLRGLKAALALAGLCHPEPAPPFAPFTEAEYAAIESGYRKM
jgi:4-hydroxy-tetrahydrodipicolinate synthase